MSSAPKLFFELLVLVLPMYILTCEQNPAIQDSKRSSVLASAHSVCPDNFLSLRRSVILGAEQWPILNLIADLQR